MWILRKSEQHVPMLIARTNIVIEENLKLPSIVWPVGATGRMVSLTKPSNSKAAIVAEHVSHYGKQ
jgi:hypothetical protein